MNKDITEQMEIRTDILKPRNTVYLKYVKRLPDILLNGIVIIILSPLLMVISILELVCHGKPILYIDKRPGKDGKIFGVYKFRSTSNKCDKNGELLHPSKRITPPDRTLRRYSLDELANLLDVFNETMSIIGPHPLVIEYLSLYNERYKYCRSICPGLGCWETSGGDKLIAASWTWSVQFESDIYYVKHVGFLLDIKMVLKAIEITLSKSEMRTNSGRIRSNETDLSGARPRHEIIKEEVEVMEKGQ